jgi:hypothetical protein
MMMMQVDTPLTIQVMAPPTSTNKTIYVRMQNVPGSVAIELTPAITSVFDIVQKFHELVFSKSYVLHSCFLLLYSISIHMRIYLCRHK